MRSPSRSLPLISTRRYLSSLEPRHGSLRRPARRSHAPLPYRPVEGPSRWTLLSEAMTINIHFLSASALPGSTSGGTQLMTSPSLHGRQLDLSALSGGGSQNHPFSNRRLDTCAVVGNGGILSNSGCGEAIDSAQFVIRCNMPPLEGNFSKDVGTKSDIVTANPSIVVEKYGKLLKHRRPFVDHARLYGDAMLLAPTFSYRANTEVTLRAFYTIQDSELPIQPVSMNPVYLKNLNGFWKTHGLNPKIFRLSTGLMMTSLAVEICDNVHLYGFWPFDQHPHTKQQLIHHYYDNKLPVPGVHSMSAEFKLLL
ncbi:alpha-2,8-sialyltransferase 8F-like [Eucyclogobius newberryi]|uniref:alpha-2,8-sialyltransferase 8F-like n=1 Tax=Eucyclogobius newberryi TaxID=166745 RepID=UPI003B5CCB26